MNRARRAAVLVPIAAIVVLALWPTRRRVGVNYVVREERIPLAQKAFEFVERDLRTRRLIRTIRAALPPDRTATEEALVLALFDWVVAHVAPQPPDRDAIDDHPVDIIARGYGAPDQRAEAFALLTTYADLPAALVISRPPGAPARYLTVVRLGDRLTVFDVGANVTCRAHDAGGAPGALLDLGALRADPALAARACGPSAIEGRSLFDWIAAIDPARIDFDRMAAQHPLRRLRMVLGSDPASAR